MNIRTVCLIIFATIWCSSLIAAEKAVSVSESAKQSIVSRGSRKEGRYFATQVKTQYTVKLWIPLDSSREIGPGTYMHLNVGELTFEAALGDAQVLKEGRKGQAVFRCEASVYDEEGELKKLKKYASVRMTWDSDSLELKITGKAHSVDDDSVDIGYGSEDENCEFMCWPPLCSDPYYDESIFGGPGRVTDSFTIEFEADDDNWDDSLYATCEFNARGDVKSKTIVKKFSQDGDHWEEEYLVASYNMKGRALNWDELSN
jgi:hypothetical protein